MKPNGKSDRKAPAKGAVRHGTTARFVARSRVVVMAALVTVAGLGMSAPAATAAPASLLPKSLSWLNPQPEPFVFPRLPRLPWLDPQPIPPRSPVLPKPQP